MFAMFTRLFAAISSFFAAAEKLGQATNHIATWAEESAGAFADEARVNRAAKLNALNAANQLQLEQST